LKRKTRRLKTLLGIVLLFLSIASIVTWELYGREIIYYENIILTNKDINEGHIITEEDIFYQNIDRNSLVDGAISDARKIIGQETINFIPKNSQIVDSFLIESIYALDKNERIMKVPKSWIISLPETLRRRDHIYIYAMNETSNSSDEFYLLESIVAYAKDNNNKEIYNVSSNRFEGSSYISDIEIIINDDDFSKLQTFIKRGFKLIIMYR